MKLVLPDGYVAAKGRKGIYVHAMRRTPRCVALCTNSLSQQLSFESTDPARVTCLRCLSRMRNLQKYPSRSLDMSRDSW